MKTSSRHARLLRAPLLAALLGAPAMAAASTYTPWGAPTPAGTLALSPYLVVGADGTTALSPYTLVGLHRRIDLMLGFTARVGPTGDAVAVSAGPVELMPRLSLRDGLILAPHLLYEPAGGSLTTAVELHGAFASEPFSFTYNVGWRPVIGRSSFGQDVFAVLAPEVRVSNRISAFVEVNPALGLPPDGPSWSVQVVPGFSAQIDGEGCRSLTAAAIFNAADDASQTSLGLLYSGSFVLHPSSRELP